MVLPSGNRPFVKNVFFFFFFFLKKNNKKKVCTQFSVSKQKLTKVVFLYKQNAETMAVHGGEDFLRCN